MSYTSNDLSVLAYANTAFGSASGDASVLAIVFSDEDGHYYLHHLSYIRTSGASDDDEATQQCKQIVKLCQQFYVPSVSVEINGIGKFLPAILKREMRKGDHHCAVVERSSRIPKSQRILEGFDAVLAARALSIHTSVKQTPFAGMATDFNERQGRWLGRGCEGVITRTDPHWIRKWSCEIAS